MAAGWLVGRPVCPGLVVTIAIAVFLCPFIGQSAYIPKRTSLPCYCCPSSVALLATNSSRLQCPVSIPHCLHTQPPYSPKLP
ncbi:hypothetical protein LY78DRAFT_492858 [Colletotrichum sublineola]|nr:hypothetical protein LY78DRAFT_492858 [Colletotrichum sublineola]